MNCPKCVGKLQKKNMEGIEVDVCFLCEGIWFDAGELEDIIKKDSKDLHYIDVGKEEYDGKEIEELIEKLDAKVGKCPRCTDGTVLLRTQRGKVYVDICPKGHGLWLDGGEIQQLRKRGFVKFTDEIEYCKDLIRYSFSKEGFSDLKYRIKKWFKK